MHTYHWVALVLKFTVNQVTWYLKNKSDKYSTQKWFIWLTYDAPLIWFSYESALYDSYKFIFSYVWRSCLYTYKLRISQQIKYKNGYVNVQELFTYSYTLHIWLVLPRYSARTPSSKVNKFTNLVDSSIGIIIIHPICLTNTPDFLRHSVFSLYDIYMYDHNLAQ